MVALLAAALLLLAVGVVANELLRIRNDLNAGREALAELDLATIDGQGGITAVVDDAAAHIAAADHRARTSAVLRALRVIPGIGGQVAALRDLTGTTAEIAAEGQAVAYTLAQVIDQPAGSANRLDVARAAATELGGLAAYLEDVDIGARGWLLPPLAWARDQLRTTLIETRTELGRASEASGALAQFLTGPRRYLIAAGNNAEMRSGGAVTASGIVEVAAGEFTMGEFLPNDQRAFSQQPVAASDEWEALYGWRAGRYRYPGATYSPNFPEAAELMAAISAANQHGPVDGVIYVDPFTLANVLGVVGPVTVEGTTYDAASTGEQLLYTNYLSFGDLADNPERKDLQGQVALAAFEAINTRDYSLFALASALADMGASRHLLAWSAAPAEQDLWQILNVDGHLQADDLFVEVANLGSSKLDAFVTVTVDVTTEFDDDANIRRGRIATTVTNLPREQTSPYIEGFGSMIEEPGEHVAWLLFYLPQYATRIRAVDFGGFSQAGPDGPLYASGTVVHIPEGESRTYTIEFDLPPDQYRLSVLPAARTTPTLWTFDGNGPFYDYRSFEYDLETGEMTPNDRRGD